MSCEKCGNKEGLRAVRLPRPMRDATSYQIECTCGHKWIKTKSMRIRHLSDERQKEIREFWANVVYVDPIKKRLGL